MNKKRGSTIEPYPSANLRNEVKLYKSEDTEHELGHALDCSGAHKGIRVNTDVPVVAAIEFSECDLDVMCNMLNKINETSPSYIRAMMNISITVPSKEVTDGKIYGNVTGGGVALVPFVGFLSAFGSGMIEPVMRGDQILGFKVVKDA